MVRKKSKKKLKEYDKLTKPYIVTNKNVLINIIKNPALEVDKTFGEILFDAIERTNKIVVHTYNFLKLYYLYLFENDKRFPIINKHHYPEINVQLIRTIMNTITYKSESRGGKPLIENTLTKSITSFYEEHYRPLIKQEDIVCRDSLKHILNYEEVDILTNIKNNIKEHYVSHLKFFFRVYHDIDNKINEIRAIKYSTDKNENKEQQKIRIQELNDFYNNFVNDFFTISDKDYRLGKKYHDSINHFKASFLPFEKTFMKDSIFYDIEANPLDYLVNMILLNIELEKINTQARVLHDPKESQHPKTYRLFNVFPLRTSVIPKYITLDTVSLISIFPKKGFYAYIRSIESHKEEVWNHFFNLNNRCFKRKNYHFNYMIKTDGVGCSILLIQVDEFGVPFKEPTKKQRNDFKETNEIKYIHEIKVTEDIKKKDHVYVDPGKNDLASCMKENEEGKGKDKYTYFEYTRGKRNSDIKKNKYDSIQKELKALNEEIENAEKNLSKYNSKICDFTLFKKYVIEKNKANRVLFEHYKQIIYRKLKFNTYTNTRRSESNMINNFKKTMGTPDTSIVILGDWSGKTGKNSGACKILRKIFKNAGYETYLIDEYNTSKICSHCSKEVENFVERKHTKKREKEGHDQKISISRKMTFYVWKLVRCTICNSIHNRDHNATKNMMKITKALMDGRERPSEYQRPPNYPLIKLH